MSSTISRTTFTRQYDHIAVIAHGAHPEYRLEFDAPVAGTTASNNIFQGSVVCLNADGKYELFNGQTSTATKKIVPMISMKNLYDPDVTTGLAESDTSVPYTKKTYSAVGGKITAIPCTGGYEIETTEFVASTNYVPNAALIASAGKVTLAATEIVGGSAGAVVGFVSKAPFDNPEYGGQRVAFFTNFIPAVAGK